MNRSKQKGNRFERECVKMAENHGFSAERAYGSNGRALGESETVDIVIRANGEKIKGQCKVRNRIVKYVKIPDDCDITLIKEDRGEIYVVIRYEDYLNEVGGGLL
jgi:Holliday junction resolvase